MHCPSTALQSLSGLGIAQEKEALEISIAQDQDDGSVSSRSTTSSAKQFSEDSPRPITPCTFEEEEEARETSNSRKQQKRRIRINEEKNVTFYIASMTPASLMSDTEKSQIWWNEDDYDHFKSTAKLIGREVRRRQSANHSRSSYSSIMLRAYAACCSQLRSSEKKDSIQLSDTDKRSLQHWAAVGICRRGLERWCMPRMARDRQERKINAIRLVVGIQDKMDPSLSWHTRAEALRIRSERLSRSSRLFALALGEADATTILSDEQQHISPMKMLLKRNSIILGADDREKKIYGPTSA